MIYLFNAGNWDSIQRASSRHLSQVGRNIIFVCMTSFVNVNVPSVTHHMLGALLSSHA